MIQLRSILKVADNTGARTIRVFRILGGSRKKSAQVGDIIIASVQKADPFRRTGVSLKKKEIVRAVIVRQKHNMRRKDGSYIRFDENAAVIVDKDNESKATRIFGPIPREIKEKGYQKITNLAEEIV